MVATDVYRPAAIDQLVHWGKSMCRCLNWEAMLTRWRARQEWRRAEGVDTIIIDTAGRLQIDQDGELARIKQTVQPHETLLVVDAMTGQRQQISPARSMSRLASQVPS